MLFKNQKDAIENQKDDEILYKYTDFEFGSVLDHKKYINMISKGKKNKHFYEILQVNQPVVLWCDIDGNFSDLNFNTAEECYLLFTELMKEVFSNLNIKFDSSREYLLNASTSDKLSLHWMYDGIDFETNVDQKEFWLYVNYSIKSIMEYTKLTFSNLDKDTIDTVLDTSVYTKNRAVRSIYNTKEGQDRTLIPVKLVKGKFKKQTKIDVSKYLITRSDIRNPVMYDIKIPEYVNLKIKITALNDIILAAIPSIQIDKTEGNLIKLRNDGVRTCIINGEDNISDNSYCVVFNDRIDYYCHDEGCSKPKTIHKFKNSMLDLLEISGVEKTEMEMYLIFKQKLSELNTAYEESENKQMDPFYKLTDAITEYMNLSIIMVKDSKTYILREKFIKDDEGSTQFVIMPSDDSNMALNYSNMMFNFPMFKIPKSMYQIWRENINRRSVLKCVFYPKVYYEPPVKNSNSRCDGSTSLARTLTQRSCVSGDTYNMFHGLAYEKNTLDDVVGFTEEEIENEGFFVHIRKRWCLDNIPLYNKVLDFFASILQRPWYKMKMCIILKSLERSGKGLPIQIFSELIGERYFFQPSSAGEVLGNFNANMGNKLLCFMDEMVWGGDKEKAGVIKKLMTETNMTLKQKYMPDQLIQNCINFFMASNEEWVVPAGTTDTRWLILNVSDELSQMTDKVAWKKIIDGILSVDRKKLAKFFYERDISNFDDRETIKTDGLREQQMQSLSKINKWWLDCLDSGKFEVDVYSLDFNANNDKNDIYMSYKTHSKDKHISSRKFWCDMKKLDNFILSGRSRSKVKFTSLDKCRDQWRTIFNDAGWEFPDLSSEDSDSDSDDEDATKMSMYV
jgi:hypothetical protein